MTTVSQARNTIRRALAEEAGLRFTDRYRESCRTYFDNKCAYCESEPGPRAGHFDHAVAISSNASTYYLVYACARCNGDEKREKSWEAFLKEKCNPEGSTLDGRKARILNWFSNGGGITLAEDRLQWLSAAEEIALASFDSAVASLRERIALSKKTSMPSD